LSVQLYSLREASREDFDAVLAELASIGYAGVEPFDLFGRPPADFRRQVEDLGMAISSSHYPWATRATLSQVIDVLGELGLTRAAAGFAPDDFADLDAIQRTADSIQTLIDGLSPHGISLFLHNHWWEFREVEGRTAYHRLQDLVSGVEFEIDTYWAADFGARDPAAEVARVRTRTPLLHIKDGPLERDRAHVAVGSGRMDVPAVVRAGDPAVLEWLVVELDHCDTDMMTAMRESYDYLTRTGLGRGKRSAR
jgi:sugar phosphate isomerase/epimerase